MKMMSKSSVGPAEAEILKRASVEWKAELYQERLQVASRLGRSERLQYLKQHGLLKLVR